MSEFILEEGAAEFGIVHEDDEQELVRREELTPLYDDLNNPNHAIFVVPTQDGSDKDDQGHGSIGDATMEHIYRMRHKMLEMEHFVFTPNGNIFRTEFNVQPTDEDGQRNLGRQIVKVMTAGNRGLDGKHVSAEDKDAVISFLKQEIEDAKAARLDKQDAMEQGLVPFEDWEQMPQMTNQIEIPSTPPVMFIYAGNTSQMFYDWIPEDHPDLRLINTFISMTNAIDWDHFSENSVKYFRSWIFNQEWVMYPVAERLALLVEEIEASQNVPPAELAIRAFRDIEGMWAKQVSTEVIGKFNEDVVVKELKAFEERLVENKKAGKLSWAELGKFGQSLYKRFGSKMSTAHWGLYKTLKKKYAPEVKLGKHDVNRASLNDLRSVFKGRFKAESDALWNSDISDEKYEFENAKIQFKVDNLAKWAFFNRPFMSLEDLAEKGMITVDDIGSTAKTQVLMGLVKKSYRESLSFRSTAPLGRMAQQIINYQRTKPELCTEQEWYSIWQAYRICKANVQSALGIKN